MKRYAIGAALMTFLLAAGAAAAWFWTQRDARLQPAVVEAHASPAFEAPTRVELSSDRLAAAGLRLAPVKPRILQAVRRVPGRIHYDESSHVAVRAPAEGVLTEVLVQPADVVVQGQPLARLASREVGDARADVLRRVEELKLAQAVLQRSEEMCANVAELTPLLEERLSLESIEKEFENRTLGEYREQLLGAYSRFVLADSLYSHGQSVSGGALAGAVQLQRQSDRAAAHAAFQAAVDTAGFDCRRARDEALLATDDARRRLEIARQRLQVLTGNSDVDPTGELSAVEILAPVSGTIEERQFSRTERVEPSDTLFVIAETKTLWVAAAVREREWPSLSLSPGVELEVQPAGSARRYTARLLYAGREMAEESHAVPLVASLENPGGLLRPGMYATVGLPIGSPVESVAVRPAAIMQHEGEKFVFVEEGPGSFRRVTVETGVETEDWVEIRRGLSSGVQVVVEGAFVLKSELLLEREE